MGDSRESSRVIMSQILYSSPHFPPSAEKKEVIQVATLGGTWVGHGWDMACPIQARGAASPLKETSVRTCERMRRDSGAHV